MHVLVVEDERRLAEVLERGLRDAGHQVTLCATGPEGVAAALAAPHDVVVLDWMLPEQDGTQVCRALRDRGLRVPILMLTARQAVTDRVTGLDAGADDYLTKPFSFDELLARIRALGRRVGQDTVLVAGDLSVDLGRRAATRAGVRLDLTAREFDLLALLVQRAGRVVTRLTILDEVWDGETDLRSNAIDVHIGRLRAKVDRPFHRASIQTVRGNGFRLDVTDEA